MDVDVLQVFMGHQSLDTTGIYAMTVDKPKTEAAKRVVAHRKNVQHEA